MNRSRKNVPYKSKDIGASSGCVHLEVVTAVPFESCCSREWSQSSPKPGAWGGAEYLEHKGQALVGMGNIGLSLSWLQECELELE